MKLSLSTRNFTRIVFLASKDIRITTNNELFDLFAFMKSRLVEEAFLVLLDEERHLVSAFRLGVGMEKVVTFNKERLLRDIDPDVRYAIMIHNHPDGNAIPSGSDLRSTRHVSEILGTKDIALVDHLIIAGEARVSIRDLGLM